MGVNRNIDITARQRETILELLGRYLPNVTVWVYGSRVRWTSRPQSDLDTVAFASPEQKGRVAALKEAFEESDLPFRVDLFIWDEVPEQFRKNIEVEHAVLVEEKEESSDMGDEFPQHPLGEITEIIKRGISPKYSDDGVPVLNQKCIRNQAVILEQARRHDANKKKIPDDRWLKKFDVLINSTGVGTLGRVAQLCDIESQCTVDSHVTIVRPKESKVDPYYFGFAVRSKQSDIESLGEGSTGQTELSRTRISEVCIPIPPLQAEQKRIAAVLGALDDKIELNRKMNKTLEAMAQAIFKSWFIDFDGIPPEELEDSELGQIPKGWKLGVPSKLVEFNPRISLKKGHVAKHVDMKALSTVGMEIAGWTEKEFKGGSKFQQGDTLLARITPCLENGKTGNVSFLEEGEVAFGSTEFIVMRGRETVSAEWVYCLARSPNFREHAISHMTGSSGRQRVPVDCFEHFRIALPSSSRLNEFANISKPMFDRISANNKEIQTLTDQRGALLPKLISGEVRVPEVSNMEAIH